MNPILKYILNLSSYRRLVGDSQLAELTEADTLLSNLVNEEKVPAISLTVLRGGRLMLQKGYGYSDLANKTIVDPKRSVFRIASVSKNIAAVALAHMVSEGAIDLDASFYRYVPYYPKKEYDFTIRQLASHTAGIRSYRGTEYGLNKPYSIKDSIEIFKKDELLFEPGTDYLYNSFGWVLISLAMQEAGGISFPEYVRDFVIEPFEMMNTIPEVSDERFLQIDMNVLDVQSTVYYTKNRLGGFRKAIPVDNFYKLAGGGYLSTSEDIAKFGQALLDGRLFPKNLKNEFLTAQIVNENSTYYGLGWQVSEDKKGRKFYGHVGNGVGGYSNFFVYPKEQMVFSALINCTNPGVQDVLDEVVDILLYKTTKEGAQKESSIS